MTTKNIKGRIQHKHDVEANWQLATNFIPMIGELIVYDPDASHTESRLKIGDGQTLVNDLPFLGGEGKSSEDFIISIEKELTEDQYSIEEEYANNVYDIIITLPEICSSAFLCCWRTGGGPSIRWDNIEVTNERKTYTATYDDPDYGSGEYSLDFQLIDGNKIRIYNTEGLGYMSFYYLKIKVERHTADLIHSLSVSISEQQSQISANQTDIYNLNQKTSLKFVGTSINLQNNATSSEYDSSIPGYIHSGTFTCSATISSRSSKMEGFIINRTFISIADLYAMKNNNTPINILYYGYNSEELGLKELFVKNIAISGSGFNNQLTYTITCDYKIAPGEYMGSLMNDWTIGFQYRDISLVSPYPEVQY